MALTKGNNNMTEQITLKIINAMKLNEKRTLTFDSQNTTIFQIMQAFLALPLDKSKRFVYNFKNSRKQIEFSITRTM